MRKIKFRGLNRQGIWIYGWLLKDVFNNQLCYGIKEDHQQPEWVKYESIGQFTGLYDSTKFEDLPEHKQQEWLKNHSKEEWKGVEVYEGDIVKFKSFHNDSYWTRPVTYSGAAFYADYRLEDLLPFEFRQTKVIGNIHQNPELLIIA